MRAFEGCVNMGLFIVQKIDISNFNNSGVNR